MGQIVKTRQQIQNEIDEIHRLISSGATDEYIMNGRKDEQGRTIRIARATFFRRKQKLIQQVSEQWKAKRDEEYIHEVQICKERLTRQLVNATSHSQQNDASPLWGAIAAELTVSILKLEVEGILAIKNGKLKQLEEKVRHLGYNEPEAAVSAITPYRMDTTTNNDRSDTNTSDDTLTF